MSYGNPTLDFDTRQGAYWDTQLFIEGTTRTEVSDPKLLGGTALSAIFTRSTPVGTIEDQAQFQVHYAMRPGGAGVSDNLNGTDMTATETSFKSRWWGGVRDLIANSWTFQEMVWRDFGADLPLTTPEDPVATPPVHKYGPVKRRTSVIEPGGNVNVRFPDQVAVTATFKTGSRKHWGRVYQGGFAVPTTGASTFGRILPANVDAVATAWDGHFSELSGFVRVVEPVVWSAKYAAIMSIDQLQVDDVFDVVRRRRAKQASYRKVLR